MTYNTSSEWEKIENKRFGLVKDLTILAGSIFGLSIAIATRDSVNSRFIFGEFFLFLAVSSGIILLYSSLSGEDFFHFMMSSSDLKLNLPKRTGGKEDFIVDAQEDLIKSYEKLTEKSKKGLFFMLLKVVKIDYFYPFFYLTFLLGVFLVFLSLISL